MKSIPNQRSRFLSKKYIIFIATIIVLSTAFLAIYTIRNYEKDIAEIESFKNISIHKIELNRCDGSVVIIDSNTDPNVVGKIQYSVAACDLFKSKISKYKSDFVIPKPCSLVLYGDGGGLVESLRISSAGIVVAIMQNGERRTVLMKNGSRFYDDAEKYIVK